MQFGHSLAQLATDIAAGYGARKNSAETRASAVSAMRADVWRTLSVNAAQRVTVGNELSATAARLRHKLAAGDAALGAAVQSSLAAARQDLAAKRATIAANARVLRRNLAVTRQDGAAAVTMFRADVRRDQAGAAKAKATSLGQFVANVRTETATLQRAVQSQIKVARAAWGNAPTKAPVFGPMPAPVVKTGTVTKAAGVAEREQRWVPR
jgi:hypothetical protein